MEIEMTKEEYDLAIIELASDSDTCEIVFYNQHTTQLYRDCVKFLNGDEDQFWQDISDSKFLAPTQDGCDYIDEENSTTGTYEKHCADLKRALIEAGYERFVINYERIIV
jgi:hypothetical protein